MERRKRDRDNKRDNKRDNNREKKPFAKKRRKKPCLLCEGKTVEYRDLPVVRRFISDRGKILPPRNTGCCAKHQRTVTKVIKMARQAGLIPYTVD